MKLTKKQKNIAIIISIVVVALILLYFFKIFPFSAVSGTCATVSCGGECKDLGFPPHADCCGVGYHHDVFGSCVSNGGGGGGGGGCSADCSCSSNTCQGSSCSDGCGGSCSGTKVCCQQDWSCTSWSSCVLGTQTRSCTDNNNCGSSSDRPAESQACTPTNCNYQDQTIEIGQSLCLEGKEVSCLSVEGVPTIDDSKTCNDSGIFILLGGIGLSGGLYYFYRKWKK